MVTWASVAGREAALRPPVFPRRRGPARL